MSDINIHTLYSRALREPDSEIRVSKEDGNKLNRGTFGQRIASWFRDQRQVSGHLDQTRKDRQDAAFEKFKEALKAYYGEDVAKTVIDNIDYGRTVTKLTGKVITTAVKDAKNLAETNRLNNTAGLNKRLPPLPPNPGSPEFLNVVATLGNGVTLENLTAQELREYEIRLRNRLAAEDIKAPHSANWFDQIASETLKQVHDLSQAGKLDDAIALRQNLTAQIKTTLKVLLQEKNTASTMAALTRTNNSLYAYGLKEQGGEYDAKALMREALAQAMAELRAESPDILDSLQAKVLGQDSRLRAIYAQIAGQDPNQVSPRQRDIIGAFNLISEAIVEGLSIATGGLSGSKEGDIALLKNSDGLPENRIETASLYLNRLLSNIARNPVAPGNFVSDIKQTYGDTNPDTGQFAWRYGDDGYPLWNTVDILKTLERSILQHANRDGIPVETAVQNFRAAIDGEALISPELKAKLVAGLDAIEAEAELRGGEMGYGFSRLQPDGFDRLYGSHEEGGSKWDAEHKEQGSLARRLDGFRALLQRDEFEHLTPEDLGTIHYNATAGSHYVDVLRGGYKVDANQAAKNLAKITAEVETDYRDGGGGTVTLVRGVDLTDEGLAELMVIANENDPWLAVGQNGDEISITFPAKSLGQCFHKAGSILEHYYEQFDDNASPGAKRLLIAETIQQLYRACLFGDGTTHAVLLMAVNHLLLEAGLDPCILPDPNKVTGLSREQFAEEILKAQLVHHCMTKPPQVDMPAFVASQLAWLQAQEGLTVSQSNDRFRELIETNQTLEPLFRAALLEGIAPMLGQHETEVHLALRENQFLESLPKDEMWRLFAGQRPGKLAGPLQALHLMMRPRVENEQKLPPTTEDVERSNAEGALPGYVDGMENGVGRERIENILNQYVIDVSAAQSDHERLAAVAKAVRSFYDPPIFRDPSTGIMLMQRVLRDAGLPPVYLTTPEQIGEMTSDQILEDIKKGQFLYRCLTKMPEVSVLQFVASEATKLAALEQSTIGEAILRLGEFIKSDIITETQQQELLAGLGDLPEAIEYNLQETERELHQHLQQFPVLSVVSPNKLWRLFAVEQKNFTGLAQAFEVMMLATKDPETPNHMLPLTARDVERSNGLVPDPGYKEGLGPEEGRVSVGVILKLCKRELSDARTENEKLNAIARATHSLLKDGVFRNPSTAIMVMQRLLLEAGLPPSVLLSDPYKIGNMHPDAIVNEIKNGQFVFAWENRPSTHNAEQFLVAQRDRYLQSGMRLGEAMDRLAKEVTESTGLTNDDSKELMDALNFLIIREQAAIEQLPKVEKQLEDVVERIPTLQGRFRPDDLWRLFATAGELDPDGLNQIKSKEDFVERNGAETLIGLESAFNVMLNGYWDQVPLTSDHVLQINQAGPRPGFRQGPTVLTTTSTGFDPDFAALDRLTQDDEWFSGMTTSGERWRGMGDRTVHEYNFSLPEAPSSELCKQRLDLILDNYRQGIETIDGRREDIRKEIIEKIPEERRDKVSNDEIDRLVQNEVEQQKRAVIARTVQYLYRSQLFPEGERQWTISMVMNRMLLDAGLPPAILREPEQLFARGAGLAGIMIHEGQNVYRKYVPKIEDNRDLILVIDDDDDVTGQNLVMSIDESSDAPDNDLVGIPDPEIKGATLYISRTEFERRKNQQDI